jgi:predicted DNA-binding protein
MAGKPQGIVNLDSVVIFRVSKEIKAQAEKLAKEDRRTLAQWIRVLIEDRIKESQD